MRRSLIGCLLLALVGLGVAVPAAGAQSGPTVALFENPFTCDGQLRQIGQVSGLSANEPVQFSSPQMGGVFSQRSADGGGQLAIRWQCSNPTTWVITVRGASSGSATFTITGIRPGAVVPATQPTSTPAPQSTEVTPEPEPAPTPTPNPTPTPEATVEPTAVPTPAPTPQLDQPTQPTAVAEPAQPNVETEPTPQSTEAHQSDAETEPTPQSTEAHQSDAETEPTPQSTEAHQSDAESEDRPGAAATEGTTPPTASGQAAATGDDDGLPWLTIASVGLVLLAAVVIVVLRAQYRHRASGTHTPPSLLTTVWPTESQYPTQRHGPPEGR